MTRKARRPTAPLTVDGWIVYIVRCADGSLYTGVTKDVVRRCRQHNAGTASRYTRSRGPVKLGYREDHPDQGSALRREAAIKAMTRREKMAMVRSAEKPAEARREVARLEDIPNVGPAIAADLRRIGIATPAELPGRDPFAMYDELCGVTGQRHDPCVLDTFMAAVRYMEGAPKKPWWGYTAERKRVLATRSLTK